MTTGAAAQARVHREVEFLARYDQLLRWAERLTVSDRGLAHDVVHDAFVHFMLSGASYDSINNLDHYLHEILRNVHRTHIRQKSARRFEQLSEIAADDSRLSAADPHGALQARNTLLAICRYVCRRKEVSLASIVLILRFLHGYYPNEVARLTRRSRSAVDGLLRAARNDLRVYLHELPPYNFGDADEPLRLSKWHGDVAADIIGVRRILFEARKGQCFQHEQLRRIYSDANVKLSRSQLSHLVSCPHCLDLANSLLNMLPLRERSPVDVIGKIPALLASLVLMIKLGLLIDLSQLLQQNADSVSDFLCFVMDWGTFWQQNAEALSDFLT
jgi:RNA polymerase sigma factor (sigma-70 family)